MLGLLGLALHVQTIPLPHLRTQPHGDQRVEELSERHPFARDVKRGDLLHQRTKPRRIRELLIVGVLPRAVYSRGFTRAGARPGGYTGALGSFLLEVPRAAEE